MDIRAPIITFYAFCAIGKEEILSSAHHQTASISKMCHQAAVIDWQCWFSCGFVSAVLGSGNVLLLWTGMAKCILSEQYGSFLGSLLTASRDDSKLLFSITTVLPLPHFSLLGFRALLQTLKSCSPEPQRLQLNRACSATFLLLL